MATQIKLRRDTAANWTSTNPVLALGEPGIEIDTRKIKYGDGTTAWTLLAYSAGDANFSGNYTDLSNKPTIPDAQIQSDWTQTDNTQKDYIKNKPVVLDGADGAPGADGASAYEISVDNGFVGDEATWLASLVGAPGEDGADGAPGTPGTNGADGAPGADGASAYEISVDNGFVGDEATWLASLDGADGAPGAPGVGVPVGGTTGQVLAKIDGTDYNTEWVTQSGGSSTGNVTFDDVTIQGVNQLNLSAGADFTANLAYVRVRSGDVASHIHVDTGNNEAYDLIVGDDAKFVQVSSTGNIIMSSYDSANTTSYVWNFGIDGTTSFPDNTISQSNSLLIKSGEDTIQVGSTITIATDSEEGTGAGTPGVVDVPFDGTLYNAYPAGSTITFANGDVRTITSIVQGGVGLYQDISYSGSATTSSPEFPIILKTANYAAAIPAPQWTFGDDGNLTLPGNTFAVNYANGTQVSLGGGGGLPLSNGNSIINIASVDGNITLDANGNIFTFGTDGNLTTPSSLVIGSRPGGGSHIQQNDSALDITGVGSTAGVQLGWAANLSAPDSVALIAMNSIVGEGAGNLVIAVGNNATTVHSWLFGNNGNLKLPAGGDILDSTGNSVLGGAGGIALTDLSIGTDGTPTGSGNISYANSTGVFTYTPPVIPDVTGFALSTDIPDVSGFVTGTPWTSAGYLTTITNIFDQDLNTTNNVTFSSVITSNVQATNGSPAVASPVAVGGAGAPLTIGAGDGGIAATGVNAGAGGNLTITAGDAGSDIGNPSWGEIGGTLVIRGGNSSRPYHGSDVQIHSGNAVASPGAISLYTGTNQWTFGKTGNLTLPVGGDILDSTGTSVLGGGIELTTLSIGPDEAPTGSGGISYDNSTGAFTYTPPVIPTDIANLADATSLLSGGSSSSIANGTSNVSIATSNGNVTIAAVGNTTMTITGTGANVTGTLTSTGKIGYASGSTVTQTTNRGNGVNINALAGTIVTVSASMTAGEIGAFTVTNNLVDTDNDIVLVQVVSPNLGNYNVIANPNSGIGGFYVTLQNISGFPISPEAVTIRFMVIKAPNA